MSEEHTDNLKKALARLIEQRRAFVKVLAGPYERGKTDIRGSLAAVVDDLRDEYDSNGAVASGNQRVAFAAGDSAVTVAAAMSLAQEGKLALSDPVTRWLPELTDMRVLVDPAGVVRGDYRYQTEAGDAEDSANQRVHLDQHAKDRADAHRQLDRGQRLGRRPDDERQVGSPFVISQELAQGRSAPWPVLFATADPRPKPEPVAAG